MLCGCFGKKKKKLKGEPPIDLRKEQLTRTDAQNNVHKVKHQVANNYEQLKLLFVYIIRGDHMYEY